MIESLISLLIIALVLYIIFFVVGKFISGTPLQLIGIVLGLVFLLKALATFGLGIGSF
jgi:hypothetical protein